MPAPVSAHERTVEMIRAAQAEKKRRQKVRPRCEVCRKAPAISFSRFGDRQWLYTCNCTADYEHYYVMLYTADGYCASRQSRDNWDRHLGEKDGEAINIHGFYDAVARFGDEGGRMR